MYIRRGGLEERSVPQFDFQHSRHEGLYCLCHSQRRRHRRCAYFDHYQLLPVHRLVSSSYSHLLFRLAHDGSFTGQPYVTVFRTRDFVITIDHRFAYRSSPALDLAPPLGLCIRSYPYERV